MELAVSLLSPSSDTRSVYDPYCRTGEFLVEVVSRIATTDLSRDTVSVHGRHPSHDLCTVAQMNLRLREVDPGIDPGPWWDGTTSDRYDVIVTNPPFNQRLPKHALLGGDWPYGEPPLHNGNFALLQHVLGSLADDGRAAVLMPNSATHTANPREESIRAGMLEDGVVECVVALPNRLFHSTPIPVSIWLLRAPTGKTDGVLLIDATSPGSNIVRGHRHLSHDGQFKITDTYWGWRLGDAHPPHSFARFVPIEEIRDRDYSLAPSGYIAPAGVPEEPGRIPSQVANLMRTSTLLSQDLRDLNAYVDLLVSLAVDGPSMRHRWPIAQLKDVCQMKAGLSGSDSRSTARDDDGTPIVSPKHLHDGLIADDGLPTVPTETARRLADYRLQADDIVLVRTGNPGRVARVRPSQQGWLISAGLVRIRANDNVLPACLGHVLSSKPAQNWIMMNSSGTTIPAITVKTLGRLPVAVPPLDRQQQIGEALDSITKQAHLYRQLADQTEAIRDLLSAAVTA